MHARLSNDEDIVLKPAPASQYRQTRKSDVRFTKLPHTVYAQHRQQYTCARGGGLAVFTASRAKGAIDIRCHSDAQFCLTQVPSSTPRIPSPDIFGFLLDTPRKNA